MTTIAVYVRVSTRSQKDERSHLRQRRKIARWAEMQGHDPGDWDEYHEGDEIDVETPWEPIHGETTGDIRWFEDIAVSGTVGEREAHSELMESYEDYDLVVVKNLARFGRAPEKTTKDILEIAESDDVNFIAIESPVDTTSANGRLMLRMLNAFNGWFAEQRKEQTEEMIERRREEGKPIGRPKKLSESQREKVREWAEDHSYRIVAVLVEENFGVDISKNTVKRYVKEEI